MLRVRPLALCLVSMMFGGSLVAAVPAAERAALIAIHQSTGGGAWIDRSNWLGEAGTECSWFGVRCDAGQNSVTGLVLCDNNLSGTIPPEIGALPNLVELELCWNEIGGTLPPQLSQLSKLRALDLSDNHIEGTLPGALLSLTGLERLDLGGNRLGGDIPTAIGQMVGLSSLDLAFNQFRGDVPTSFLSLTKLADGALDLRYNAISVSTGSLRSFLERKQAGGDVLGTQTLPPKNLQVRESDDPLRAVGDVIVSWTPPAYVSDPGGYQISAAEGGALNVVAVQTTASKELTDIVIKGLKPVTRNYFAKTVTHPHGRQQNTLTSAPTDPVLLQVFPMVSPNPRPVVGARPPAFVQTGSAAAAPATFQVVNIGDYDASVSLVQSGSFFTHGPSNFVVDSGSSETITIFPKAMPAGSYEGAIVVSGVGISRDIVVPVRLVSTAPAAGTVDGAPAAPRLDVASERGVDPKGSVTFSNRGTATLRGFVKSDVEWLAPKSGAIEIAPGGTAAVEFTIDRARRPDATTKNGAAFSAALTLEYVDSSEPNRATAPDWPESGGTGTSTSLVTVVDSVKPPVRGVTITPLGDGELALFVPGVEHRQRAIGTVLTDLSIANAHGVASIADLRLFFSAPGAAGASTFATLSSVGPRGSLLLADVVSTIYGLPAGGGSLQIRSFDSARLLARARIVALTSAGAVMGTPLPVFLSTRSARSGDEVRLPGLGVRATEADLVVQETSGAPAKVRVEYLDAAGARIGLLDPVSIEPFGSIEYRGGVPGGTAAALVTNRSDSSGRIAAYGLGHDAGSGDAWLVADWARREGYDIASAQKIVYAPAREASAGRRRPVRPASAVAKGEGDEEQTTLELTLHNAGLAPAGVMITYHEGGAVVGPKLLSLGARETRTIDDAVGALFGRGRRGAGWLAVEPRRGAPVAVSARLVTTGGAPSVATVPVAELSAGLRLGQTSLFAGIDDARQETIDARLDGAVSTTLGLTETGGKSATARVTMSYFDGSLLAARVTSKDFVVGPDSVLLLPNIARAIVGDARERELGDLRDIQLEVRVIAGDGALTPFVIATDCGSGDASIRME